MAFGILTLTDALATENLTVLEYGERRLWDFLDTLLQAHDEMVQAMVSPLVQFSPEQRIQVATPVSGNSMQRGTEFSRPLAQKITATPQDMGWPMEKWQYGLGFTRDYLARTSVQNALKQVEAAMEADIERVELQIKHALFDGTNYTFIDERVDRTTIYVKALQNADNFPILRGPNNTTFDASVHNHYLAEDWGVANATTKEASVKNLVDTVREHDTRGQLYLYINIADQDTVESFTKFKAVQDTRIIYPPGGTTEYTNVANLDITQSGDRVIGIFREAMVVVKPWVPANYMVCCRLGAGVEKILQFRSRNGAGVGRLGIEAEWEDYPLRGESMMREFGVGVSRNRVGAAILYTGAGTYAAPTLE